MSTLTLSNHELFCAMQEGFLEEMAKQAQLAGHEYTEEELAKLAGLMDMMRGGVSALRGAAGSAAQGIGAAAKSVGQGAQNFLMGGVHPTTGLPMKGLLGNIAGQGMHTGGGLAGSNFSGASKFAPSQAVKSMGPSRASDNPLFGVAGKVQSPQQAAANVMGNTPMQLGAPQPPSSGMQHAIVTPKPMGSARSGGGFSYKGPGSPSSGKVDMFGQPAGPSPFAPTAAPQAAPRTPPPLPAAARRGNAVTSMQTAAQSLQAA